MSNKENSKKMGITNKKMKLDISIIFENVSFRKFGNAFRKHIDKNFTQEMNHAYLGAGMLWSEQAYYIIADGSYRVTESQYKNFMNEFN